MVQNQPPQGGSRKISFNVSDQYEIQDIIGEGAYGVVCSAIHKPSGQRVAIKKITPFDHSMFCLRTLREMKLLRYFNHENIISILDIQKPRSYESFTEVYLIQVSAPIDSSVLAGYSSFVGIDGNRHASGNPNARPVG